MFQQGGKFYLNTTNWKRYQYLNYKEDDNNQIKHYRDEQQHHHQHHIWKLSQLNLKHFQNLRKRTNSQKTGVKNGKGKYTVSCVQQRLTHEAGSNTGIDIYKFKQKMANTLSVMTNVLRNVVSKQRIRYKEKGFNLDLAYVCDNIIAMGYPAEKYESMYRNRLEDVYKFLEENHHGHYKIYNLCLERSYDIKKFHGRVSVYPFEDHNPPTIELILKFCEDVDTWLKDDASNVAAVHCKAGKGRTGTMICCYLLYSGQQRSAEDALSCYDEKRTKDRKGVTIPSQRRYVQYFSKLIRLGLTYERRTLQFCEIRFSEANLLHSHGTVLCSISVLQEKVQQLQNLTIDFRKNSVLDMKNPPLPVAGDIKVELTKNAKKIFHFWFNTFFVTDSAVIEGEGNDVKFVYTLHKWEIDDAHKDKEHKCFSEDFKVELVFYVDDSTVGREHMKVSSSNRLTTNHRSTSQNAETVRLPPHQQQHQQQQQSNNYSLPQNNSSGSEMNFCDQKSSSSASVSSIGGGCGTDTSNGYESNRSTTTQHRKSGGSGGVAQQQQPFSNHHNYMATSAIADATNNSVVFSLTTPAQHMALPPGYMEPQQQQQQHKNNKQQQQHFTKGSTTPNQRHLQRQISGGVGGGEDIHAYHATNTDATCEPSTIVKANSSNNSSNSNLMATTSYNNHHSNNSSSKTSSVSSQSSSSAIGDNEEDWESGESQAKQIEHITLLLSTSSLTPKPISTPKPTPTPTLNNINTSSSSSSTTTTSSSSKFSNTFRNVQNINTGILHFSNNTFSSPSTITPSSNCSRPTPPISNNKCNTSSSSCKNRVVGGDVGDDDEYDYDNNEDHDNDADDVDDKDDRNVKLKKLNSNLIVKQKQQHKVPVTNTNKKSLESSKRDDNNINSILTCDADNAAAALAPSARPKLMHLLMAPKNMQSSSHKPIFKRKSSYKLVKGSNSALNGGGGTSSAIDCPKNPLMSSVADATMAGSGGGVATTSKQKLKIKLKKNKLKLSQKFQWFQSYFRTDPVDFCENFVQQTTSMRRNSICSMASRTHKLSTTTPPSVTPPPAPHPAAGAHATGSSCEQLDTATSVPSVSTSNASIATGDLCEDYYSSICDNQLSFSNSPCKSPRSMADMARSISGSGGNSGIGSHLNHGSFGSSFTRSAGSTNQFIRERRETLPGCSSSHNLNHNGRRNVVIVAAKPAKTHAIGFNVNNTATNTGIATLARQDSMDFNGLEDVAEVSPASIYYTPTSALIPTGEARDTAFVFPQIQENVETETDTNTNSSAAATNLLKPQAKYSLNLVIVKECTEPNSVNPPSNVKVKTQDTISKESDDVDSDCCDQEQNSPLATVTTSNVLRDETTLTEELEESAGKIAATTCASVCSNSSSSGFCTSECCTTNSSSSSCNCNPFALDLERHVAAKQQNTTTTTTIIPEVIEAVVSEAAAVAAATAIADDIIVNVEIQNHSSDDEPLTKVSLNSEPDKKAYETKCDQ